jgi:hypothetical protein
MLCITYCVAVVFAVNIRRSPSLSVTGKEALYTQGRGWGVGMGVVRPPPGGRVQGAKKWIFWNELVLSQRSTSFQFLSPIKWNKKNWYIYIYIYFFLTSHHFTFCGRPTWLYAPGVKKHSYAIVYRNSGHLKAMLWVMKISWAYRPAVFVLIM